MKSMFKNDHMIYGVSISVLVYRLVYLIGLFSSK